MAENVSLVIGAVDNASNVLRKVGGEALTMQRQVGSAADALKASFAGIAAGFTVVGIANAVRDQISSLAALDDAAEKTGASVEKLSAAFKVAKISGIDTALVEASMVKLTKTIAAAGDSGSEAAKGLRQLGLSQADLKGKDTADALKLVADRMNEYADGSGKTALAMTLLGKSGAEALPYLKDLAETQELVGTTTAKTAAQAEEFEKNMNRLSAVVSGVGKSLAADMLPSLVNFSEQLLEGRKIAGGFLQAVWEFGVLDDPFKSMDDKLKITRAEIEKNREALKRWQDENAEGAGHDLGDDEKGIALLQRRLEMLKVYQRQQALANSSAADFDARDNQARFKPSLADNSASEEAARNAKTAAKERLAILEAGLQAEIAAVKAGEKDKLDIIAAAEKLGTLSIEKAGHARVQSITESVSAEVIDLAKIATARKAAGDQKGYIETEAKIAEAVRRVASASREATQAVDEYLNKQKEMESQAWDKVVQASWDSAEAISKQADSLEEQVANFGLSEEAIYRNLAAQVALDAQQQKSLGYDPQIVASLEAKAAAYTRMANGAAALAGKQIAQEEAEKAAQVWKDFSRDIEQSLTDSLYRAFENGDDFGKAFAKSLENTFKTMVLKASVQAIVNPVMAGAQNYFGGMDAGTIAAGATLPAGAAGPTTAGASAGLAAYAQPAAIAVAAAMVAASLSDQGFGHDSGSYSNINRRTAGLLDYEPTNVMAEALQQLGFNNKFADTITGASIINRVAGGVFGGKEEEVGRGVAVRYNNGVSSGQNYQDIETDGGLFHSDSTDRRYSSFSVEQANSVNKLFADLQKNILTPFEKAFSVSAGFKIDYSGAADGLVKAVEKALVDGITASDVKDLFDGVTTASGIEEAIAGFAKVQSLLSLANQTGSTADAGRITLRAGGAENTASLITDYYANFITEAEKVKDRADGLADAWVSNNLLVAQSLPKTREGFVDLVESLDLTGDAGQRVFAELMKIAPAFNQVAVDIDKAADAAKKQAEENAKLAATYTQAKINAQTLFMSPADAFNVRADQGGAEFAAAGLSKPKDSFEYRSLIAAQDEFTEAGRRNLDILEKWSGTFGEWLDSIDALSEAADKASADFAAAAQTAASSYQTFIDAVATAQTQLSDVQNSILQSGLQSYKAYLAAQEQVTDEREALTYAYLSASNAVEQAQTRVINLYRQTAQELGNLGKTLTSFITGLDTTDIGGLSSREQYSNAQAQFAILAAQAKAGDQTAAGKLPEVARTLLELSRANAGSRVDVLRDAGLIKNTLADVLGGINAEAAAAIKDASAVNADLADKLDLEPLAAATADLADAIAKQDLYKTAVTTAGASLDKAADTLDSLLAPYYQAIAAQQQTHDDADAWLQAALAAGIDPAVLQSAADAMTGANQTLTLVNGQLKTAQDLILEQYATAQDGLGSALADLEAANAIRGDLELRQTTAIETFTQQVAAMTAAAGAMAAAQQASAAAAAAAAAAANAASTTTTTTTTTSVGTDFNGNPVGGDFTGSVFMDRGTLGGDLQRISAISSFKNAFDAQTTEEGREGVRSDIYNAASANNVSLAEVDGIFGLPSGLSEEWARSRGLPVFAGGGFHAGGLRIVGENGPELEATGPSRVWNFADTQRLLSGGGNDALIRELIAEVKAMREEQRAGDTANVSATKKVERILRDVSQDGTAITTVAA